MSRSPALGLALVAIVVLGCTAPDDTESCVSTFEYHIALDVTGAAGSSCDVAFVAGTRIGRYTFAEPCSNVITHPTGSAVPPSATPTNTQTGGCWIYLDFVGKDAHDLSDYMGSESFDVTVGCGSLVFAPIVAQPKTEQCYL